MYPTRQRKTMVMLGAYSLTKSNFGSYKLCTWYVIRIDILLFLIYYTFIYFFIFRYAYALKHWLVWYSYLQHSLSGMLYKFVAWK